ncbi:MAG TPA: hypothetical protein VFS32_13240 [Candidatus Limnocylindrales bacterium]|nr:hypothetical protein [Candidatus Limnocylindrales bacterium]
MSGTGRERTTGPSAGLDMAGLDPDGAGTGDTRLVDLEERLARLERRVTLRDRGRSMVARMMPPEASEHFRQAGRHQLLGLRSIIDFWIDRVDRAAPGPDADEAERIEIE